MSTLSEVYEAFKLAGVPEDIAPHQIFVPRPIAQNVIEKNMESTIKKTG